MPARVTSTRFVGRRDQLAELASLLDAAAGGRAKLAFVTGESGMGKTRLVEELAAHARRQGARVLAGDCVELGESELPYAPIVSALRPLVRAGDPVLDELGPARGELAALLPELGAAAGPDPAAPDEPGVATRQARLFETLLGLLERLGRDAPVLLVVEDVHWADRSTRDFLVFLSRVLCHERVLVVATYRSDELHRRHPLRPALTELERSEHAHRVVLEPFSREELVAQLADILGAPPGDRLTDRLLARSEGNPLFAEELLAAGGDGAGELPPTLRDALMLRVEALSADAQEVLRVVGAAQRADHELLLEVSGLEPRALRDALREAVGERLLDADEDGRHLFRHALLREAVHDDLLPGEHAELHALLGAALERREADTLALRTEVAHHFLAAGDRPRALAAAVRAATLAEEAYANGEAAAMLEQALGLWEHVEDPAVPAGCDHVALLRRAAQAHGLAGDHHRMRVLLQRAIEEVDEAADPRRAAALHERLGKALWDLGRGRETLEAYDRALAVLPEGEAGPERATVLAARARALMLSGHYDQAAERAQAALGEARGAGDRRAEDSALNTVGVCRAYLGEVEAGEAALRESMRLAREDGRVDDLARGYVNLAGTLFHVGRARDGRDVAHAGFAELEPGRRCLWLSLELSEIDFHLGDWAAAEEHALPGAAGTGGTVDVLRRLRLAELALGRGDHAEATALLERARDGARASIEPQWHGPIAALLAQAYRRDGRFDDARAAVDDGLRRVPPGRTQAVVRLARIAAAGVATEADRAELARARGRQEEAEEAVRHARRLVEVARQAAATPRGEGVPMALGHLADAEAEVLRAEGRPDAEAYRRAAERWDGLERVHTAALARRRLAETLAVQGDRAGAAEAAATAREAAGRLGARWLVEELDGLARRARLRLPGDAPATAEPDEPDEPDDALGLTAREREVLALLADGRTNRQIGETLFMAEKTASVHVSRILAKLGVRSRTEAAAVAHRLGLAART